MSLTASSLGQDQDRSIEIITVIVLVCPDDTIDRRTNGRTLSTQPPSVPPLDRSWIDGDVSVAPPGRRDQSPLSPLSCPKIPKSKIEKRKLTQSERSSKIFRGILRGAEEVCSFYVFPATDYESRPKSKQGNLCRCSVHSRFMRKHSAHCSKWLLSSRQPASKTDGQLVSRFIHPPVQSSTIGSVHLSDDFLAFSDTS